MCFYLLIAWLVCVAGTLLFFHAACSLDDEDPVDIPQDRSEIESWRR